jgi:hypothetical protein
MLTGNKGEWSEIYTLFKLIADGEMLKGDSQLLPIPGDGYRVIGLERNEATTGTTSYTITGDSVEINNSENSTTREREAFRAQATELLEVIKSQTGTFEIPSTEQFMNESLTHSIKARSQDKTDIKVEIHDHRTSIEHTRGFSIKSQLGSPSTLLNASQQTVFRYKLENLTQLQADEINSIEAKGALIARVQTLNCLSNVNVTPVGSQSETLSYNLRLMDDALPDIVSSLLWNYYGHNTAKLDEILPHISEQNIRSYQSQGKDLLYSTKLKRLLVSAALGMKPAQRWDGRYDANGGYLIVLNSGEIISYHIYDKDDFEDYLFHNTKLDTPSTSRYSTGTVFNSNGDYFIDLGLQIRFCI